MEKTVDYLKKYRWALLILLIGIVLMLLPGSSKEQPSVEETPREEIIGMEQELAHILSQIQGAGNVQVLLTESTGAQTVYQTDKEDPHEKTVIITGSDRAQSGLVQQVIPPKYMGAIVVCNGADNASVRLAIVEAVSKVTGLGADRISVLKMK
jgi:stage III sporulation protein AG